MPCRFGDLPDRNYACVYAVDLGNGIVKVGRTKSPKVRMEYLSRFARKEFGCDIARAHISPEIHGRAAYLSAEFSLLKRLRDIGTPHPKYREFFTGVTFEQAVALAA
jgi:hypothetical protein